MIVDQFISSSEDKWHRLSGLVMLLPHGMEGQGPEHSSARLERFLLLCAESNMQVVNLTTPAQLFHCLRRQVIRPWRKPLIVMSPKSLLRHRRAISTMDELAEGSFQRIIPDDPVIDPSKVRRVVLCTGKVYYDLLERRAELRAALALAARVGELSEGAWHGPILSGYGVHLVYVHGKQTFPQPSFAEVRDRVAEDWTTAERKRLNDEYVARLLEKYDVVVEDAPGAELAKQEESSP